MFFLGQCPLLQIYPQSAPEVCWFLACSVLPCRANLFTHSHRAAQYQCPMSDTGSLDKYLQSFSVAPLTARKPLASGSIVLKVPVNYNYNILCVSSTASPKFTCCTAAARDAWATIRMCRCSQRGESTRMNTWQKKWCLPHAVTCPYPDRPTSRTKPFLNTSQTPNEQGHNEPGPMGARP